MTVRLREDLTYLGTTYKAGEVFEVRREFMVNGNETRWELMREGVTVLPFVDPADVEVI